MVLICDPHSETRFGFLIEREYSRDSPSRAASEREEE
jgi:hypothetical protein